jgi:hypothetical protein
LELVDRGEDLIVCDHSAADDADVDFLHEALGRSLILPGGKTETVPLGGSCINTP